MAALCAVRCLSSRLRHDFNLARVLHRRPVRLARGARGARCARRSHRVRCAAKCPVRGPSRRRPFAAALGRIARPLAGHPPDQVVRACVSLGVPPPRPECPRRRSVARRLPDAPDRWCSPCHPVGPACCRAVAFSALNVSASELATFSRDINHLTHLLRSGSGAAARVSGEIDFAVSYFPEHRPT